ncbi:5136_t:CDS:2 [Paraglomus brasilianum]|uniref:5136_t:CDS:1 n=1 Tax=Paraglomus brasilianum TaxID=144538 RepID=A0A9N8Z0X4_9GLOM|nr:5136_t:CDS:2 [Paraglomus brasilianum]
MNTLEDSKCGWLTKLGGNALRKSWKRRWFVLRDSHLYYYRNQTDKDPSGVIPLVSYNTVTHDSNVTKKSANCIRIEKVFRSSDSISSTQSHRNYKPPPTFLAFADTAAEMQSWLEILQRRVGERNIVDIVLDRLDLHSNKHGRHNSISSYNDTASTLSSRPSIDSLNLETPSLGSRDSRKSSFESIHRDIMSYSSRPETPTSNLALGIGIPILRKPISYSCLQERRITSSHIRNLSFTVKEGNVPHTSAPTIMVHDDDDSKTGTTVQKAVVVDEKSTDTLVPETEAGSPSTPMTNIFPSHLA